MKRTALLFSACMACSTTTTLGPVGLDPAHVLVDANVARLDAVARDGRAVDHAATNPAEARQSWAALGLAADAGVSIVLDDRVVDARKKPVPIALVRVVDRAKLQAKLAERGLTITLTPAADGVEDLLVDGEPVAYVGQFGGDTAVVPATSDERGALRRGFVAFLGARASGAPMSEAAGFRAAIPPAARAGLFAFAYFAPQALRAVWRKQDKVLDHYDAIGLALATEGFGLRLVPTAAMRGAFARLSEGVATPHDLGRYVPATGWAAAVWRFDLGGTLSAFLAEPSLGFGGWQSQVKMAKELLSGEVALACDVESVVATIGGRRELPQCIAAIGARDGALVDGIIEALGAGIAIADPGAVRSETQLGTHRVSVWRSLGAEWSLTRDDSMLLVATDTATLATALEPRAGLGATKAGAILGAPSGFGLVADVSPIVAALEGRGAPGAREALPEFLQRLPSLPLWKGLAADPVLTLSAGFDGTAMTLAARDHGVSYAAEAYLLAAVDPAELMTFALGALRAPRGFGALTRELKPADDAVGESLGMAPPVKAAPPGTPLRRYEQAELDAIFAAVPGKGRSLVAEITLARPSAKERAAGRPSGTIHCTLDPMHAPQTVANFIGLANGTIASTPAAPASGAPAKHPFYDGLSFHRIQANFVIQAGNPTGKVNAGPGWELPLEEGTPALMAAPGALAMVRGHRDPPSQHGSQFFINARAFSATYAGDYVAFGHCDRPDLVRQISLGETLPDAHGKAPSVPTAPVRIATIRVHRAP